MDDGKYTLITRGTLTPLPPPMRTPLILALQCQYYNYMRYSRLSTKETRKTSLDANSHPDISETLESYRQP